MHKFNYFCSVLLVITLPLMIVILTSNLVLRVSETYQYHFNDSQVMSEIEYNIKGATMADTIASYWSSFSNDKIQVYEDNGIYKDPVFKSNEQVVMSKVKAVLNLELGLGLLLFAITIAIYIYLWKGGYHEALRNRYWVSCGVTVALLIGQAVFWITKSSRYWIYNYLIGDKLPKTATISIILGDPFYKTYVLFATITGLLLLAIFTYVNYKLTKPNRIFY